jgi:hypothetical protein
VVRHLVAGWNLSAIFTVGAGQPYSARVGAVDLNNDGNRRNDLAPGTTRNQFTLPTQYSLDPRIARDVVFGRRKAQVIWEAFNLFNADDFNSVETAYYTVSGTTLTRTSNFGAPLSSTGPRIMQLAVKVMF